MKKRNKIISHIEKIWDCLYKHRYIYGLLTILVLVTFQISGSSIGVWKTTMGYEAEEGVLIGKSRQIRSDEWGALTPMSFSQVYNGFNKTSGIVRGSSTDVSLVYALPTLQPFQIFRPFQIGYFSGLVFGPETGNSIGLSFYWCARLIILFLVALDFFMIFTKKNKLLSTLGAIMIACAPVVQWWFAVNGIAEIFIFGMGLIVATCNYLSAGDWSKDTWKKKILCLVIAFISIGGYALVLYPAWQIPMAYVFGILWLYIVIANRKKINKTNSLPFIATAIMALICLAIIILNSKDVISVIMNTSYPGKRTSVGGDINIKDLFDYMVNLFLPFKGAVPNSNQPESATFITLFPIGIIATIVYQIKKKKLNYHICALIAFEFIICTYAIIGLPEILAKISLFSFTTPGRAMLAAGFIDIFLLIYSLSNIEDKIAKISKRANICAAIIAVALSTICAISLNLNYPNYIPFPLLMLSAIVFAMAVYLFFTPKHRAVNLFALLMSVITIVAGMTVNPIRSGVKVVYTNQLMDAVKSINNADPGNWVIDTNGQINTDFLLMSGIPTINSVNTYPDLDRWRIFDGDEKFKEIYNRYAWIMIHVVNNHDGQDRFKLIWLDAFSVNMTTTDLVKVGAKYVLSDQKLNNDGLKEIEMVCGWYIYMVDEV